jgi:predicted  nucleic acid-binding Zn-ribbon protein
MEGVKHTIIKSRRPPRTCNDPLRVRCVSDVYSLNAHYCYACRRTVLGLSQKAITEQREQLIERRETVLAEAASKNRPCCVAGCGNPRYSPAGNCLYCWEHRLSTWSKNFRFSVPRTYQMTADLADQNAMAVQVDPLELSAPLAQSSMRRCSKCGVLAWSPFNSTALCSNCSVNVTEEVKKEDSAVQSLLALRNSEAVPPPPSSTDASPHAVMLKSLDEKRKAIVETHRARLASLDDLIRSVHDAAASDKQHEEAAALAFQNLPTL